MLQTASSVLSHFRKIEVRLIEGYSNSQSTVTGLYISFAKEHMKELESVERTYREAVSDAYSVAFLPEPLDETNYKEEGSDMTLLEKILKKFTEDASIALQAQLPEVAQTLHNISVKTDKRLETMKNE